MPLIKFFKNRAGNPDVRGKTTVELGEEGILDISHFHPKERQQLSDEYNATAEKFHSMSAALGSKGANTLERAVRILRKIALGVHPIYGVTEEGPARKK